MNQSTAQRKAFLNLIVLLAYAGVAVGMTWPITGRLSTHLPGHTTDTLVHYWNGWWAQQALSHGQSPFHTEYLFHPQGLSLVYHNFAWLNILGWTLLELLIGGFAAYNIVLLLNLALCGLTAFLLVSDLTGDKRAALLAGLIYQNWPYRLSQLDHPNLISTQWIPLFFLFLIRTVHHKRWQDGLLTGLLFALIGYTRWQLLIPTTVMGGLYFVTTLAVNSQFSPPRDFKLHHWARPLALAAGIACLALAPPALSLLNQQLNNPATLLMESEESTMQTDLLAYITPSNSHPLAGAITQPAYNRYYTDRSEGRRFPAYIGIITFALALWGVWNTRRSALPWVTMAITLVLLALGPVLRAGGELYPGIPMPYRLAQKTFVIRLLRTPDRFSLFLALPMAVLAGYGLTEIPLETIQSKRWLAFAAHGLLGGAILFEYLIIPAPTQLLPRSSFYVELSQKANTFAVLNLPIGPQRSKLYMFNQVFHQHPVLQGKTARFPEDTYAYLDNHPLLRTLRRANEMNPDLTDVSRQLRHLAKDDVRYMILHKDEVSAKRLDRWQRYLAFEPHFEDEHIVVYTTSPSAGHDFNLLDEIAPGIGPISIITSTDCLNPGGVLEIDVAWGTSKTIRRDFRAQLMLVSDGATAEEKTFPISSNWPTHQWPANSVAWSYYILHTDPALAPGTYTIELALIDPTTGKVQGHSVSAGQVEVKHETCDFAPPAEAADINALFGDALRLVGYDFQRTGSRLAATLYWRSERRMATDYKIFVHIFDPATGVPVAQIDAMPHQWDYPTSFWGPGETVKDTMSISLEDAPEGSYGIAVGVYNPETIKRLTVMDGRGQHHTDGRLVLPKEKVTIEAPSP